MNKGINEVKTTACKADMDKGKSSILRPKHRRTVPFIIAAVLILLLASLIYYQFGNIRAAYLAVTQTPEQLLASIDNQRSELKTELEQYQVTDVRDLTVEETMQLLSGSLKAEQVKELITVKPQEASPPAVMAGVSKNGPLSGKVLTEAVNKIVDAYAVEFYALKAEYLSKLGATRKGAVDEFLSYPPEKRTDKLKRGIVADHLITASALEVDCDNKVKQLLSAMKTELTAIGGDLTIIGKINQSYENEKELQKAYLIEMAK